MSTHKTITTSELDGRLQKGEIPHFWNVLTDDFFTGEIIPGSRRVRVSEVVREARKLGLGEDEEIVVYCSGPDCPQSTAAAEKLAALGFRNVFEYENGLEAWTEAGHSVEEATAEAAVD